MNEHIHAIILIKNEDGKYLQYFDKRWNTLLFPNCKLIENNEDYIKKEISKQFSVLYSEVKVKYLMDKIHSKYSQSAKKTKIYHHFFYKVEINNTKFNKGSEFEFKNTKYYWKSISELEGDYQIMKINSDIIGFVKTTENDNK